MTLSYAKVVFLSYLAVLGSVQIAAGDLIRFVDNRDGAFLKHGTEISAVNAHDVAAATASLLGVRPLGIISSEMDKLLNTLLGDDPFSRPHAVFAVSLTGAQTEDLVLAQFPERQGQTRFLANSSALQLGQALRHLSGVAPESAEALVLDVSRGALMDAAALDDALEDLALALGASYERGSEAASGKLSVPGAEGEGLQLDLTQDADYLLASELAHLERAAQTSTLNLDKPQLLTATLHGIQVIKMAYGPDSRTAMSARDLVLKTVARALEALDRTFQGRMIMLLSMFDQTSMGPDFRSEMAAAHIRSAASQRRELLQAGAVPGLPGRDIIAAYILTNRSVAWGVGILLIIFTIVSVVALVCMPLTKDTLLYSRAKLD